MATNHHDAGPVVINETYEMVATDQLQVHPSNPNQGDMGAIIQSIEANGFVGALLVQRSTSCVIAGNHRLLAAMTLGLSEVPVIWVDVDDERAERLLLADNRIARLGMNDESQLAMMLQGLAMTAGGLEGTGFDGDDLDALINDLNSDAAGPSDADKQTRKKYNVTVRCSDEEDQEATFKRLLAEGYDARIRA
jgi:ParB-like chromosome segregation protein Spo0J